MMPLRNMLGASYGFSGGSSGDGGPRAVRLAPCRSIVATGKRSEAILLLWVDSELVASDFPILSWTGNARSLIMDHDSNLCMNLLPASSQDVPGIARKSTACIKRHVELMFHPIKVVVCPSFTRPHRRD